MKQRLMQLITACCVVLATSGFAQSQDNELTFTSTGIYPDPPGGYTTKSPAKVPDVEVNVKALRHLAKQFRQAGEVHWYKVPDGYFADFTHNGNRLRVGFDDNGNWVYNLVSYAEGKLPREVWHLVRSTYYNYSITWVNEVKKAQQVTYIVHLKNSNSFKNVRVIDGEMHVMEDLKIEPVQQ